MNILNHSEMANQESILPCLQAVVLRAIDGIVVLSGLLAMLPHSQTEKCQKATHYLMSHVVNGLGAVIYASAME